MYTQAGKATIWEGISPISRVVRFQNFDDISLSRMPSIEDKPLLYHHDDT